MTFWIATYTDARGPDSCPVWQDDKPTIDQAENALAAYGISPERGFYPDAIAISGPFETPYVATVTYSDE